MEPNANVPFQLAQIITNMLNKKEPIHIRQNYHIRLQNIRAEIDSSLKKFEDELFNTHYSKKKGTVR